MNTHISFKKLRRTISSAAILALATACTGGGGGGGGEAAAPAGDSKGIGPVSELKLVALDSGMAEQGKAVFTAKCSACHKFGERFVGPDLKGVTKRRQPEWIMNMILNPSEMIQKDAVAKELLAEYLTQMTFQNISQEEARKVLEHFRSEDSK